MGNDGLLFNVASASNRFGIANAALSFVSQSQSYISLDALLPKITGLGQATVSLWFQTGSINGQQTLFGDWGDNFGGVGQNLGMVISLEGDNVGFSNNGGYGGFNSTATVSPFAWYSLQVCLDGSQLNQSNRVRIYLDGLLTSNLYPDNLVVNPSIGQGLNTFIGRRNTDFGRFGSYYTGSVDDVRIYNRALSSGEVAALYQYESVPQKSDLRQATAAATVVNGFVVGATITDGGSGYTKAPKVVISGGGGTGATATATIDANGSVTGISIVSSGSKYTGIPIVTIDAPPFPPSQAQGTATLINGFVTGVNITDGGHGYEGVIPPVTFVGGGGRGAKGIAIVNNGVVTGISMTASGSGYTQPPYALIAAPPGLARAEISVHSVDVTLHLIPGYTYKIQTAIDAGSTWIDAETGILAVDATLVRTFDVTTNTQLFRVVQTN